MIVWYLYLRDIHLSQTNVSRKDECKCYAMKAYQIITPYSAVLAGIVIVVNYSTTVLSSLHTQKLNKL